MTTALLGERKLRTFDEADESLQHASDDCLIEMRYRLRKMQRRLEEDMRKGYIDQEKFNNMADGFYHLVDATISCNLRHLETTHAYLKDQCAYKTKVLTKYTILGALAGAFLIALGVGISVVSHGAGLPLGAWIANIGAGLIMGGAIGSQYREIKSSRAISKLNDTGENHLRSKGNDVPSFFGRLKRDITTIRESKRSTHENTPELVPIKSQDQKKIK